MSSSLRPAKLKPWHLDRTAVVYVRQSTLQQVHDHRESTARQYALAGRATDLGWPRERVLVIDDDLGRSGQSAEGRPGFQRLLAEIALDRVGLVLGLEVSRLARSCKHWHQLLELCARFRVLLADADGVYDPADYNDRLLLGLKGTMSEAELHVLRERLYHGKLNKVRRGELLDRPPVGYVQLPTGEWALDPHEQVRATVLLVFDQFDRQPSVHALLRYLARHGVQVPVRPHAGEGRGRLEWRRPNRATLLNLLRHPAYAGAYRYGYRQVDPRRKRAGQPHSGRRRNPLSECPVLLRDRVPAYIPWDRFEANQARLTANRSGPDTPGRRGPARPCSAGWSGAVRPADERVLWRRPGPAVLRVLAGDHDVRRAGLPERDRRVRGRIGRRADSGRGPAGRPGGEPGGGRGGRAGAGGPGAAVAAAAGAGGIRGGPGGPAVPGV